MSVVIPTYNRARWLGRALASVLAQSDPAGEIIVVDDGSSDGTAALVRSHAGAVRYLYQRHAGVSAARNRGIEAAENPWIALLDSDDAWLPAKLARQLEAWRRAPHHRIIHCD